MYEPALGYNFVSNLVPRHVSLPFSRQNGSRHDHWPPIEVNDELSK